MNDFNEDEQKAIIKQAITEWLDEKYTAFGKWTLHGLMAACLGALAYFLAIHGGFK
jgi:hypothetical protein